MNALPLKPGQSPADIIDELITSHGIRAVLLAIAARIVKQTRPPDIGAGPLATDQPELAHLDDHLRADIGLPPKTVRDPHSLLARAQHRDLYHF